MEVKLCVIHDVFNENFNLTINDNLPPINSNALSSIDAVVLFKYKVYKI